MSLNNWKPGPNHVNEYLISAIPWVTSSTVPATGIISYSFPAVTSFFTVKNVTGSSTLRVGFTNNGIASSSNYFTLAIGESFTGAFRVKELFLSGTSNQVSVIAGLTSVLPSMFPVLTGSDGWPGIG